MAQQSARRGRKNQGFPPCREHAVGDMVPVRELPYGPAAYRCITGRTDGSIRLRVRTSRKPLATEGASTDGKRTARFKVVAVVSRHSVTYRPVPDTRLGFFAHSEAILLRKQRCVRA